jgi:hypothetical protein
MTLLILGRIAHIHDDRCAAIERGFGFFYCYAWNVSLCEWRIT